MLILQKKIPVLKAAKGYPALQTSAWTESYKVLGPIQPEKQPLPLKFKIHYISKYKMLHSI